MATASPAELQAELLQLIADAHTTNYLAAGAVTLAIVEFIGNFQDEVNLVWKSPRRISNAIYLWIRYFSLITVSIYTIFTFRVIKSDHTCRSFLLAEAVTASLIGTSADVILVLRVWILYGKSRRLLYIFVPVLIMEIIVEITVGVLTILPLGHYFHIGPAIPGCYSLNVPRYFTYYAVPFSVTSFAMFCLTLYKCGVALLENRTVKMPLMTLFLRDGLSWFLIIFALSIGELFVWARGRPTLSQLMVTPWTVLNAAVSARILLNLKNVARVDFNATVLTGDLVSSQWAEETWMRTQHTLDI